MTAAFRLKNGIVPCSIVGNGPEGLVRVLARFERDALPCRCLVHPSRLLHVLPPVSTEVENERERRRRLRHVPYGEPEEERIGITGDDETPPPCGKYTDRKEKIK